MKKIYLIVPGEISDYLKKMVKEATAHIETIIIKDSENLPNLQNRKIIFAIELNEAGYNIPLIDIMTKLSKRGSDSLGGSQAVVLIHSKSELYTKSATHNIIFLANQLGCRFPGHPIVEATESFENFRTWQKKLNIPLNEIGIELCKRLRRNFIKDNPEKIENPKILVLHASSYKTSNTLMLWEMIRKHLHNCDIEVLHVENGTIIDCKGCSYITCKHYSKKNSCFYGGTIVSEVLPAIERADAVIWVCPNYNDSISAKITAIINRITVLYRKTKFYNKTMFGIIVSGSSGSDSVAKQLIGSLNINKSFRLPPYFAIMATANDPKAIMKVEGIETKAKEFAKNILNEIKA